jgi:acetyl esterase
MKKFRFVLGLMALVVGLASVWTYSWTYTSIGRLDYMPAVMARLASWSSQQAQLTPEARHDANQMVLGMMAGEAAAIPRIEERTIVANGVEIPIRIYWPDTEKTLPLYLDIHGGGWWMGDGFIFENRAIELALGAQVIVVSVDYRLAPEHPFPAALDDCWAALNWMYDNAESLGGDPERIAVGGGSAGGNLAAAVALRARDEGGPGLLFQHLLVPATDLSDTTQWPSFAEAGDDYVLKVSGMETMKAAYVPNPADRLNPYVSPLLADDHSGLPSALVITAHFDPLRDQGKAYADALARAGVEVVLHQEPGSLHGFMGSPDRAKRMADMAALAIKQALSVGTD